MFSTSLNIQVTEEVTPKPVEAPDVEIIEEVDEPLTNKPEDQDPQVGNSSN